MLVRRRRFGFVTVVSTGLLLAGVLTAPVALAAPQASNHGVTFTSTPITSAIVTHQTVTATGRSAVAGSATSNGDVQDQLPNLSPKAYLSDRAAARAAVRPTSAATIGGGAGGTPRTARSFIGQQGSNITCSYFANGCNPPDMAIAASPQFVLQGVNTQWEVLDTSGNVLSGWPVSAQSFFHVPNQPGCDPGSGNQPFLSDPRAFYDATDHRFWAAMLQVEGGLGIATSCPALTLYWIAVSQTSDPSGSWNVYAFEMAHGTPFLADYTQIGLNHDALFFSANMFGIQGGFYAEVLEANKSQMEHGQSSFTVDGFANLQGTGPGTDIAGVGPFLADTVQPVFTLGGNQGDQGGQGGHDGLFVDTDDGPDLLNGDLCSSPSDACRGLIEWRMHNPIGHDSGGAAPTLTATYLPNTQPFAFPPPADEPTCSQCVDGNDLRIPATPMFLDGTIYTGWGTAVDNGSQVVPGIIWAEVHGAAGGSPSVNTGSFTLPGDEAATYPAFMPSGDGQVVMLYEHMSGSTNPEAKYVVHDAGAPFTGAGRVLKAGEASYRPSLCGGAIPVCRWGDYEAASFDGSGRIWFAGEYANSHTDPTVGPWFGRNWGTWIGAVNVGG